ncbi:glycosyltransferase [Paenibacillus larvae]|uniref:MGDG synthase family glycosyltransferase n=1 Tax=Paenibacillus larvae TaxID=1464 RepID=UPI00227EDE44|nr:glycosyltransferase [Paenibacillus larvae]MCY9508753.1 glycosyltransferase [Paenibacillus larvae]MCY9525199.1 glycosyltransferase [Paenibacillus larvae]
MQELGMVKITSDKQIKVLVLTGSLGHGHIQVANAIREMANRWDHHQVNVEIIDYMELVSPNLHDISSTCFLQWVKHFPSSYGLLFEMTRKDRMLAQFIKSIRFTSLKPLIQRIEDEQPDVIIITLPAASAAVSKIKERGLIDCPAVTVITDHTDHSFWLHPYTDKYWVGSEDAKNKLLRQGIPASSIEITGIPVRPVFYETYDQTLLREQYGLNQEATTILLMGGGCGLIDSTLLRSLEEAEWTRSLQFVVICGRNKSLRKRLERWSAQTLLDVHVIGYTKNVHDYMAMADLMITKSGGVTTAEAIARRLPLLIYKPLPGQEQDNIDYLIRNGVACCADNRLQLFYQLFFLITHEDKLQKMRARAQLLRQPKPLDLIKTLVHVQEQPVLQPSRVHTWFRRSVV